MKGKFTLVALCGCFGMSVFPVLAQDTGVIRNETRVISSGQDEERAGQVKQDIDEQVRSLTRKARSQGPRFGLSGIVEKGRNTPYSINGEDFSVDPDAISNGKIRIGDYASVEGPIAGGKKRANNVIVAEKGSVSTFAGSSDERSGMK